MDDKRIGMKDFLYLGEGPADESCAQVGEPGYSELSKAECLAYIKAIKRVCGEPPEGAVLRIKTENHDFGLTRTVIVQFDADNEAAVAYAEKCEDKAPGTWAEADMVAPVAGRRGRV